MSKAGCPTVKATQSFSIRRKYNGASHCDSRQVPIYCVCIQCSAVARTLSPRIADPTVTHQHCLMSFAPPPPFYYLDNFQRVLDWIAGRYSDLLSAQEHDFIRQFPGLPQSSRALLTRMVMRKGDLFRSAKLVYAEIGCPNAAAKPLADAGWITCNPSLTIDQLFGLLRKDEIVAAFRLSPAARSGKKNVLLEQLRPEFADARPLTQWVPDTDEQVYAVNVTSLCERLRLMFFGNLHQDWSEFVLSDLGIYRYEQVEFSASSRGFRSRQDIEDYLHLHRCRERFDAGEALDEIVPAIPALPYDNAWLEGRRHKLLYRIAYQYERCGELQAALALYRDSQYPGARLRAIRVQEKSGAALAAFDLAELAAHAPENEAEQQALLRILPRLRRKLGHAKVAPLRVPPIEEQTLTLPGPSLPLSVEQVVQSHLSCAHNPVFYVENTLINSLFGLLCWPAIFAALPGAFFHPFHHGPADLHRPDFFQQRRALFTACLSQLDDESYRQTIVQTFHAKSGIQSPFVFWSALDEALLTLALDCIPAAHLKKYFERILRDIPANRSGLPDLIQFWPQEKRYRLLEVKGPGDRLQDNQIRWINYCNEQQMPVAVAYVEWREQAA